MALTPQLSIVPSSSAIEQKNSFEATPLGEISESYKSALESTIGNASSQETLQLISNIQRDERISHAEKVHLMEHFFDAAMNYVAEDMTYLGHSREVVASTVLETNRETILQISEDTKSALIDFLCRPVDDHDVSLTSRVAALELDSYSNRYPSFKRLDDSICRALADFIAFDPTYQLRKKAAEEGEERDRLELAHYIAHQIAKNFEFECPEIFTIEGQPDSYIYWWIDKQLGLVMNDDYFKNTEQTKSEDIIQRTCIALRHGYQRALGKAYALHELGFESDGPEFTGYQDAPEPIKLQAKQYFWAGVLYPEEHSSFAAPTESSLYRDASQFAQRLNAVLKKSEPPQGVGRLAA